MVFLAIVIVALLVFIIIKEILNSKITIDLVDRALPRNLDEQSIRDKIVQLIRLNKNSTPREKKKKPGPDEHAGSRVDSDLPDRKEF